MNSENLIDFTTEAAQLEKELKSISNNKDIPKILDKYSIGLFSMLFTFKYPEACSWQIMHFPHYYDHLQTLKDFKKEKRSKDFHNHKPFFDMFFNFIDNELLSFIKDKVITNKA